MQIEAGKYYRDANGAKHGPMRDYGAYTEDTFGWSEEGSDWFWWDATGKAEPGYGCVDLVAEWYEGPVRTETVTKRRIVPGVYGLLHVNVYNGELLLSFDGEKHWSAATATELDDLAMVASQLAEALRDD